MNNNKLWFKAKRYGWGWTPCSWEGWLVLVIYVFILIAVVTRVDESSHSVSDTLIESVLPAIFLVSTLIAICYWKGEKPGWRWGGDEIDKK